MQSHGIDFVLRSTVWDLWWLSHKQKAEEKKHILCDRNVDIDKKVVLRKRKFHYEKEVLFMEQAQL